MTETLAFAPLYSRDEFLQLVSAYGTKRYADAYRKHLKDVFAAKLAVHICRLAEAGALNPFRGTEGHEIPFAEAWNALAGGTSEDIPLMDAIRVSHSLDHFFLFPRLHQATESIKSGMDIENATTIAYADLLLGIEAGTLGDFRHVRRHDSPATGETYILDLAEWQPKLSHFTGYGEEPIEPVIRPEIEHNTVTVHDGDMLACDWIDMEAFVNRFAHKDVPGMSSDLGSRLKTARYAKEGVIHVYCGNSSPTLLTDGDGIVIGSIRDDMEGYDDVGRVCCDIWWTTIVERSRLREILVAAHEWRPSQADKAIEEYVDEHRVVQFKLSPGVKHLYSCGQASDFSERFASPDLPLPEGSEPFFVVSGKPLALERKQDAARAPRN